MQYLNRAKRLAAKSVVNFKHAAIVFKGGAFIAEATNTYEDHAEVAALKLAKSRTKLSNLTLLSLRISRTGQLRLARPCAACMAYILEHGVCTIWYSHDEGFSCIRL